ncbi:sialate O-acetylesterase [Spirosoma koreense]
MTFFCLRLRLVLTCLLPTIAFAQISITSPVSRMVFQRNSANQATILITGMASPSATTIQAQLLSLTAGQGQDTDWTTLSFLPGSKAFQGTITATAGWYQLVVRSSSGNTLLDEAHVNRVGIGEVFVLAGQSNMVGGFERQPGAADDRVSCIDFRQASLDEQLLPLAFSHVSYGTNTGPSQPPYIWGRLGDKLVSRLNVPVLFLGAATAATGSDQWKQSADGNVVLDDQPFPYRRLGVVLQHYIARTGVRAILWHQGEGDIYSSQSAYFNNIQAVIQKTRQQTGFDQLPWVVSRVSYTQGRYNSNVIAAQNQLIASLNAVFAGPTTDDLQGSDNRLGDDVHLGGNGLVRFAEKWDQALSNDFFARSTPYTPNNSASLITSGYTLPTKRRPGETIQAPSLRNDAHEADNNYVVQLVRASDNSVVTSSSPGTANPLTLTLPANLPSGQYRFRTVSTHPVVTGTLSETFAVDASAPATNNPVAIVPPVPGGTADASTMRLGYSYDAVSHGFYLMAQSDVPVDFRLERIDGGGFNNSGWQSAVTASQVPGYSDFADYNYFLFYSPPYPGSGGVESGRYRLSVRRKGDNGSGFWCEANLLPNRNTLFLRMEEIPLPPDLTPIMYTQPSTQTGTTNFGVVGEIYEVNSVATNGLITLKVNKDPRIKLSLNPMATSINGRSVQNSAWMLDSNGNNSYYIITTNQVIAGGGKLSFGLNGVLTAGTTTGALSVSVVIVAGSGGEVNAENNTITNKIDYFQN